MRRAAAWASVAAVAAVAAGFARWPLSPTRVAEGLNARASPLLVWSAPESATVSALPWPNLRIVDAQLNDALGVNLVSAPEARLDVSLGALIAGRIAPTRAFLVTPTMTLNLDLPPFAGRKGSTPDAQAAAGLAPLASLSLSNGVLRVVSKARGLDSVIENVQGRLDGLAGGDLLRVGLSAVWRDAPLTIYGSFADPVRAANGEPSAFSVVFASPLAEFKLNGALIGGGTRSLAGDLSASSHSLAALARLVGLTRPSFLAADDLAISGAIKATPTDATLDEATIASAGQTFQGALHVSDLGGRPIVSGTLDSDQLAIAPLFGSLTPLFGPEGEWSERPFGVAPPGDFDLDLRLSAGRLDVYGRELANAAASAILKDGILTASLIEAAAYGGRLNGEIRLACLGGSLQINARAKLADADFGAAFSDFGWQAPSGKGTGEFDVRTAGRFPAAALVDLGGSASLTLEQGAVAGINLEEALRRSQRRPIDVARDMRVGGTAFDRLSLELAIGKGVAHVVNGELAAHGASANLEGAIDLPARSWNLRVNAVQTDASGDELQDAAHLTLDIDGPWSQPTIRAAGAADARAPVADPATAPAK